MTAAKLSVLLICCALAGHASAGDRVVLENGTVIDHLNPGLAILAIQILDLPVETTTLIGSNLRSGKMGRKDILKIAGIELSNDAIKKLALFGPHATVSLIRDFELHRKFEVTLPEVVEGILRCPNPNCITCHERVSSRFQVLRDRPLRVRCDYCERRFDAHEIQIA